MTEEKVTNGRPKRKLKPGFDSKGNSTKEILAAIKAEKKEKAAQKRKETARKATSSVRTHKHVDLPLNETARKLVHYLVWEGLNRSQAIKKLGKSESYAYQLLRSPAVMAFYRAELEVLRSSSAARTLHRLEEIQDQDDNLTAAVQAAKILVGGSGSGQGNGPLVNVQITPGYVIDVSQALTPAAGQLPQQHAPMKKVIEHQQDSGIRATQPKSHGGILRLSATRSEPDEGG